MNIFTTISNIWTWFKDHALYQIILFLVILIGTFIVLSIYPITYDKVCIEIKDNIQVTRNEHYVVRTEISKQGAEVKFCQRTYYGKVENKS